MHIKTAQIIPFPPQWVSIQPLSPIDLVKFIPGILFATDKDKLAALISKLNGEEI